MSLDISKDVNYHLKSQADVGDFKGLEPRESKQEAAETPQRIVKAAAAKFRLNGIGGTGLSDLMAAAGLTHGGFYQHFESKDQLVAEACAAATESAMATFFSNKSPKNGLKGRVTQYLSRS